MIAAELILNDLLPLRTSTTGEDALSTMQDFHVSHLPVVDGEQLLGILSEDDILSHDIEQPVGSYRLSINFPLIRENDHLFEVMTVMSEYKLTTLPVVDEEGRYVGMIKPATLIEHFARMASFSEPGAIIVMEMHRSEYSLAELSRLAEAEDAAVLAAFVSSDLSTAMIEVTLKINRQEADSIVAAFKRFGYGIKGVFTEQEYSDALKERFESLMNYLNV